MCKGYLRENLEIDDAVHFRKNDYNSRLCKRTS